MQKLLIVVIAASAVLFGLSWISSSAPSRPVQQAANTTKDVEPSEPPQPKTSVAVAETAKQAEEAPALPLPTAHPQEAIAVDQEPADQEPADQEPIEAKLTPEITPASRVVVSGRVAKRAIKTSPLPDHASNVAAVMPADRAVHNLNKDNMAKFQEIDKFFMQP